MWLDELVHDIEGAEAVLLEGHPPEAACDWALEAGCDVMIAAPPPRPAGADAARQLRGAPQPPRARAPCSSRSLPRSRAEDRSPGPDARRAAGRDAPPPVRVPPKVVRYAASAGAVPSRAAGLVVQVEAALHPADGLRLGVEA